MRNTHRTSDQRLFIYIYIKLEGSPEAGVYYTNECFLSYISVDDLAYLWRTDIWSINKRIPSDRRPLPCTSTSHILKCSHLRTIPDKESIYCTEDAVHGEIKASNDRSEGCRFRFVRIYHSMKVSRGLQSSTRFPL